MSASVSSFPLNIKDETMSKKKQEQIHEPMKTTSNHRIISGMVEM